MRADATEADRRRDVREAARGWRRSGAIEETALAAVVRAYPDDRVRLGPAFRALAFIFTVLALNALFFFVVAAFEPGADVGGALAIAYGLLLAVVTDVQVGRLKRDEGGTETATALVGLAYVAVGAVVLMSEAGIRERTLFPAACALAVVAFAAGAKRWGMPVCAVLAGVFSFLLLAQSRTFARLLWIAAALVTIPALLKGSESPRLPPAHRRSCQALLAIALVALYAAVHLGSWDNGFVEALAGTGTRRWRESPLRPLAIAGTALVPLAAIAFGVSTRRRLFLDLGLALGVASLVTLRFYVHVAPLWVVLAVGGAAAVAAALAAHRFLASGPGRERRGLTAEPLFEDLSRQTELEAAAALATAPEMRTPTPDDRSLHPGGGRFGGGGARGEY
jgi:hypothetical protein